MSRRSQAEMFIDTLAEILEDERARMAARLLRQNRDQAERFMNRLPGNSSGRSRQLDMTAHVAGVAPEAMQQSREA